MKPFELLDSMDNIRDKFILEAEDLEKLKAKPRRRPRGLTLLAAALTVSLLVLTAFAASNFLGIRDMTDGTYRELPSEADAYIETQQVQVTAEDITCTVVESLFDTSYFMVNVNVTCGEGYVLIPPDAEPSAFTVSVIGLEGDETLEEYAARQGKKLLHVSGGLENRDELGIGVTSLDFESQSDSSMTVLFSGQKSADVEVTEATVQITVREADSAVVQRIYVPFTVNQAPAKDGLVLVAENPDAIPGLVFHSVTITEDVTGMTVSFDTDVTDENVFYKFMRIKADELTRFEGGYTLDSETDKWQLTWSRAEGTVTDTLTVRYYDMDDELLATIVYKLSED